VEVIVAPHSHEDPEVGAASRDDAVVAASVAVGLAGLHVPVGHQERRVHDVAATAGDAADAQEKKVAVVAGAGSRQPLLAEASRIGVFPAVGAGTSPHPPAVWHDQS
jgi:hypothetical protein